MLYQGDFCQIWIFLRISKRSAKFDRSRSTTFWIILIQERKTDRKTNRHKNKRGDRKTHTHGCIWGFVLVGALNTVRFFFLIVFYIRCLPDPNFLYVFDKNRRGFSPKNPQGKYAYTHMIETYLSPIKKSLGRGKKIQCLSHSWTISINFLINKPVELQWTAFREVTQDIGNSLVFAFNAVYRILVGQIFKDS